MAMQRRAIDYDSLPEADLVRRAKAGEGEAFRAIMQRCNQRLFRTARAVLRDEAEAEDVVQEVYVRAFSRLADFRGESAILTWLTRIALNEARGRLRKRKPTVDVSELSNRETAQVIQLPGAANPEADVARNEIRRILEVAVDDLPEIFRTVFILRDVEGCSIEETAENLGLNPATVKTRLHRARAMLRKALDEKLASAVTEAFPFLGVRCQRITDRVMERLALS
ncbi:MAG: RNA polymerase sigma factor [Parcubacteria group bacterium]